MANADEAVCTCDSLAFGVEMPASVDVICRGCPIPGMMSPPKKDFISQTSALLLLKQRTGEHRPIAKPCGQCPETKHRTPSPSGDLQFVWPYWHAGANGDEIRFSVRSVERFYDGKAKCTIIGDRPPWYSGHYILQRRVPVRTQSRSYRDMLAKVWTMATHAEIDAEFVWMMDDIYFLKPFTVDDIQTPRAERWRTSKYNKWQTLKTHSMELLTERGLPNHDYATHMPHHVEKAKLHDLFGQYDLHNTTLIWEVVYGNTHRETPQPVRPFLSRIGTPMDQEQVRHITRLATVLNHTSGAWCDGIRAHLMALMPDRASMETDQESNPVIKPAKGRVVKRRPVETHRGYVKVEQ